MQVFRAWVVVWCVVSFFGFASACASLPPLKSGSGLLLNVQPPPPSFSSSYDFELLKAVTTRACAYRGAYPTYWVAIPGLDHTQYDRVTYQAISAAAFKAVNSIEGADTLLLMRVTAAAEENRVCATVYGRGVRVSKTGSSAVEDALMPVPSAETNRDIPTLDRDLITMTVQGVMREILQCATFDHGQVKVTVTVAPNGLVSSATVASAPAGELGPCVANELKKAVFPPSRSGGTFTYPFKL